MLGDTCTASTAPNASSTILSPAPTGVDSFAARTPPPLGEHQLSRIRSSRLGAAQGILEGGQSELEEAKMDPGDLEKRLNAEKGNEGSWESAEEEWTYPEGGQGWIVVLVSLLGCFLYETEQILTFSRCSAKGCFVFAATILGNGLTWGESTFIFL